MKGLFGDGAEYSNRIEFSHASFLSIGTVIQGVFLMRKICLSACFFMLSQPAYALEYFEGKVVALEPTYLPGTIAFHMDTGNSTCPAGKQLKWSKADIENNKAVYSTLLAAFMSGKRVRFYVNDGDNSCFGTHLHLIH